MATKKYKTKSDSRIMEMPGTIGGAKVILPSNKPSGGWPKINQGTHLTVKTFEDGRTELIWDWDVLVSEVRAACLKAESTIPVTVEAKPKRKTKEK